MKMMSLSELQARREEILRLAKKYGAFNVRIFGSIARGDADAKSDIDFLVNMEPCRSLFDLGGLLTDLQMMLGCAVDIVTEKGLRERIRERVLREAVTL
jgi:predicted nucleotidyltransferase